MLTLSLPVINGNDGANSGVLALNLDLDKIADSQNACKAFNAPCLSRGSINSPHCSDAIL
ncbi:hypothetical protein [Lelliottia sp. WAP21]|uniref:hypothetical protein n=1 Tax=Lelliottia sp. WAP21 TaxID=2877426 RepID=UPI001E419A79|nr:hypothetical protein [Lelliottia sp. WAP21]